MIYILAVYKFLFIHRCARCVFIVDFIFFFPICGCSFIYSSHSHWHDLSKRWTKEDLHLLELFVYLLHLLCFGCLSTACVFLSLIIHLFFSLSVLRHIPNAPVDPASVQSSCCRDIVSVSSRISRLVDDAFGKKKYFYPLFSTTIIDCLSVNIFMEV